MTRKRLLYQKILTKTSRDWIKNKAGQTEIDLVEHCGSSAAGEFINSLATVDVNYHWWETEAIMGRAQKRSFTALKNIRKRSSLRWSEIHSDNDTTFINWQLFRYAKKE